MAERRRRTAVLISGRGSNLQALIRATSDIEASAEIALVLANRADAGGLDHAAAASIPQKIVDHRDYADRNAFDRHLSSTLEAADIELVCLAGFMRVLSPWLVERWRDRLLNIHPSLLPAFRGLDTHRRAIEAGVRLAGCTVHFVRAEVDAGPIIVQGAVPVLPDDTPDSLAIRVLEVEHRCYPLALELVASGRARIDGERVHIDDGVSALLVGPEAINPEA